MIAEIVGSFVTGSLALLSDAMHMATDSFALLLALIAIYLGRRPADILRTYGYARFEILAATVNALLLLGVAFISSMKPMNVFRVLPMCSPSA